MDPRRLSSVSKILSFVAALALLPASASAAPSGLEGHWANPKKTTIVNVGRCGTDYCAIVLKASAKAQANARKGGTEHYIGTEILRVRAAGDGIFKGKAFDPESNMHVSAIVTMAAPGVMDMKGCAFFGMICEQQRWTKAN